MVTAPAPRLVALALAALLAACGAEPPPASTDGLGSAAQEAPARPRASPLFDVGEIKSAAEYALDPEFAGADLKRGELLSLACAACHTFGAGQPKLMGPNLHGVFGRPAASVADYAYSPGLRASGLVWTPHALEAWLADPARFVEGTTMAFAGYRSAEDRRALIAYLLRATQ